LLVLNDKLGQMNILDIKMNKVV